MQWTYTALAALLAGGTLFGVVALRGDPQEGGPGSNEPPAIAAADPAVTDANSVAQPAGETAAAPTDPEVLLAEAEAERDRLRAALDAAAAERDALAETLAAREAAEAEPPASDGAIGPGTEVGRLLAELAEQAAEIDRLKTELAARDAELATLRTTAEILPIAGPDAPAVTLIVAPDAADATADEAEAQQFAAALEAAKSGVPLPRPAPAAPPGDAPLALVLFESGSSSLTTGGTDRTSEAATALAGLKAGRIVVTGHSDTTGDAQANMRLSRARAEAVAAALVAAGLPAESIEIAPRGQTADALPVPTALGVSEPLNRCAGIYVVASAD